MAQKVELPKFTDEPYECLLKMDKALEVPLGIEYVVVVEVGGEKYEACIPAWDFVSHDPPLVSSTFVGTLGERMIIVFPPSSMGTSIWHIPEESLAAIRVEE